MQSVSRVPGRSAYARLIALIAAAACFTAVGLACASDDGGRDIAAGLRSLKTIRGAKLGAEVTLPRSAYGDAVLAGTLASEQLTETSGLVASRRRDDLLWAINDSGTAPLLHAVGVDGADRGNLTVEGANAVDWEDVASFEHAGRSYLLVADTGDNLSWRKRVELLVVEEPDFDGAALAAGASAAPAWRIAFRFEDGPRDCEAIAVDGERVLLVAKRTEPPGLYELPLLPHHLAVAPKDEESLLVARRIGDVPGIPPPTRSDVGVARWLGRYFAMPTALDIAPGGRFAAILTYREAYLYERGDGEDWPAALARAPQRIPLPAMAQAEGIAFARDGRSLFVTSEGRGAPLFRLSRPGDLSRALSLLRE